MNNAIFITFDDKFADHAKRCLHSLKKNYRDHPEVLAFYEGTNSKVLRYLKSIKRLRIMPFSFDFIDLKGLDLGIINSPKIYFRYILWTGRFSEYNTIVHIDVDTIILKPFPELFEKTDFFAVNDYSPFGNTLFKTEKYVDTDLIKLLAQDGLDISVEKFQMINAGVFVIPKKYRTEEEFQSLLMITRKYSHFTKFADQACISLWCYKNNISFSNRIEYNFQASFLCNEFIFIKELIQNNFELSKICIFHFTWWKPDTILYQKFIKSCNFITGINKKYIN